MLQNVFAAINPSLAPNYVDYNQTQAAGSTGALAAVSIFMLVLYIPLFALLIAPYWRVFTKAGEKGWKVLVPFYNLYVALKLVGKPGWWLILLCIPLVNIPFTIIVAHQFSKAFNHGAWLTFLYFTGFGVFVLAYSHDQFTSPIDKSDGMMPPQAPPAQQLPQNMVPPASVS